MTTDILAGINEMPTMRLGRKYLGLKEIKYYFDDLGYKIYSFDNFFDKMFAIVVKDFQRHSFSKDKKQWDSIIGKNTKSKMCYYDRYNFCPEVYEDIFGVLENIHCYKLEKYILSKGLKGLSWAFVDAQDNYDVNILHNIAHAVLESASGTSFIARRKNNLYGFKAYDSSPYASAGKFADFPDCIDTWTKWWVDKYLIEEGKYYNGNNEKGVNVKYATSPIAGISKSFIVQNLRKKLKNDN